MPTNANTFNSRVTSEALEAKFRQVFPAQGGAELVQDLFASGVIQPVVDFSTVAEGSVLAPNLQTAWDFATDYQLTENTTSTLVSNAGFWRVEVTGNWEGTGGNIRLALTDGLTSNTIWSISSISATLSIVDETRVVFLRSGDSLTLTSTAAGVIAQANWRQIADVNGNLVNPLGFTFT